MGVACEHCGVTCRDPCTVGWTKCVYYRGRTPSQRPEREPSEHQGLDTDKPHRGTIENWGSLGGARTDVRGYSIAGELNGRDILTTTIREQDGDEIETLNNRYTLGTQSP